MPFAIQELMREVERVRDGFRHDVLAGDLVAAGYAVGVDGEQDAHAVPGAGDDLGGGALEASHSDSVA